MVLKFQPKKNKRFFGWKIFFIAGLLVSILAAGYFYYLYTEIRQRFAVRKWSIPSRVFSAAVPLYPGQHLTMAQVREMLEERRYQEAFKEPLTAGEFRESKGCLTVHLRGFNFPAHAIASQRVQFDFHQNKISRIRGTLGEIPFLELEPLEIARLFGPQRESRLLINIRTVPNHLVDAVLSIEDHRFYDHRGVDWLGITRALWKDLRARKILQGGSTITQQLIKNYFLEPAKSFKRKILEAFMAIIMEMLYTKDEILELYLNEIYLGQRGSVAIHGVGEAARYYFGRNVEDLTLPEAALLAGMIRAPNSYSPLSQLELARDRRNTVLKRMVDLKKNFL